MRHSLHLGLLVAALATGCGKEEEQSPPPLCYEDSDCTGGKFCGFDDRYGAERCLGTGSNGEGGSNGSGGHPIPPSDDTRCGNSPLNGRYLWDIGNCESGAITPGAPVTCSFKILDADSGRQVLTHYDGLTTGNVSSPYTLVRRVSEGSISCELPLPEGITSIAVVNAYNCAFARQKDLFSLEREGDICPLNNLHLLMDEPYPGQEECARRVFGASWISDCFWGHDDPF